ncbi:MAG: tRNA (adenosine(37)-N6)-threonylcarbamoyltransferase complex transferase subunit TsaD [Sandaracinaceae bacterium]|nr:tRNA (adenosine(37)-N6)-threonylcarbamoyltransferase complex transferase subunit TsaD [Myxococcales bacterium]MCB9661141.1 tRNA (adenosine(37)-N6)-threonylcarbamoyltransferase complex transferase subunit TsaD [Sandaracinaceae bacterium]
MIVLGIESSCDETAAALVRGDGEVLSDVVASQVRLHAPYGGVVPEIASRAHLESIVPVVQQALAVLPGGLADVDAVAVTNGPGLSGALLVGIQFAKALAFDAGKPFVGVNHLDGHLLAVYLRRGEGPHPDPPPYPFVALLASGGHTALYRVDAPLETTLLGQTRDDAAGEAFDKCAKLLGLGYPGGPAVDRLAATGDPNAISLPMPMAQRGSLEFSFSGLKTAIARRVELEGVPTGQALADTCASFQRVVVETLARKGVAACQAEGVSNLVLGGGVAANRGLRETAVRLGARAGVSVHVPPRSSCTDNAAMIAYAGAMRLMRGERDGLDLQSFTRDKARARGRFRPDGTLNRPG